MAHHDLKTDPDVFKLSQEGLKPYEIRFNDRNFQPGDTLTLRELVSKSSDTETGKTLEVAVTGVLSGYGLRDGWVCLSVVPNANEDCLSSTEKVQIACKTGWAQDTKITYGGASVPYVKKVTIVIEAGKDIQTTIELCSVGLAIGLKDAEVVLPGEFLAWAKQANSTESLSGFMKSLT